MATKENLLQPEWISHAESGENKNRLWIQIVRKMQICRESANRILLDGIPGLSAVSGKSDGSYPF